MGERERERERERDVAENINQPKASQGVVAGSPTCNIFFFKQ